MCYTLLHPMALQEDKILGLLCILYEVGNITKSEFVLSFGIPDTELFETFGQTLHSLFKNPFFFFFFAKIKIFVYDDQTLYCISIYGGRGPQ